ncbi:MAG: 3-oxoacyl-ACP reductase [Nevskiaceae bacterium]|nr:MAG: 3-oxoacyl-ACP reductase [Nevskiaceae bacterium]
MSDRYLELSHTPFGKALASLLGLPQPPRLRRAEGPWSEQPLAGRHALVGASTGAQFVQPLLADVSAAGASLRILPEHRGLPLVKEAAHKLKLTLAGNPAKDSGDAPSAIFLFDASGFAEPAQMRELYDFMQPVVGQIPSSGRVLVISRAPSEAGDPAHVACATALRGFIRALGKEIGKKGATANLLEVQTGGEDWLAGPLRFFLSEHAAFISGQVLPVGAGPREEPPALPGSLRGKVALVTGAARGIGAAIAETLAREGASVIGMDHPSAEGGLGETMSRIGGIGLALDVTARDAAQRIAAEADKKFGGLDIVVHNAGVTRDKMLRNMAPHLWDMVLDINFGSILRINDGLLKDGFKDGARIVCISSIGGIGGNAGQTNYAATKAGIIGYAESMAAVMAKRGGAINAVAPGFIETAMTAAMPVGPREVGRRLSALGQGGLPVDIAEAVAFFSSHAAGGINGRTLRVCGQNFMGA